MRAQRHNTLSHAQLSTSYLVSVSVLPMSVGELPLQHYNTVLCLSRVLAEADACFLFANDDIMPVAANRMARLVSCAFVCV